MAYIFSIHVPIAGMSLIPVLFNLPLVMLPVQIVFLELVIDPACSIVFESEKEERNVMDRPPRQKSEGLFTKRTLALSLLQGFVVLGIVLIVYVNALARGFSEDEVRTLTFTTIVVANLFLILTNRSWSETALTTLRTPNKAMWWVFFGTIELPAAGPLHSCASGPVRVRDCASIRTHCLRFSRCFKYRLV